MNEIEQQTKNLTDEERLLILKITLETIMNRFDLFYKFEVACMEEYNQKNKCHKINYELIFVDEFMSLIENKNIEAIENLKKINRMGRAAGVYIIFTNDNMVID